MFERKELKAFLERGEMLDGIPCGFWIHFPKAACRGEAAVQAHLQYYQETGIPLVKVMNEHPLQIPCEIKKSGDWRKVQAQNPEQAEYYREYLDEIRRLRSAMGENAFLLATIHGVLVSACHATDGMGKFPDLENTVTRHLKEDPKAVAEGLTAIAKTLEMLSLACLEAGADGIYYAALGGEENRFSEELYTEYVKPLEVELLGQVKEKGTVILHICKERPRLTMYQGYPCHAVNWAEHSSAYSLEDGVQLFPEQRLIGGFDNKKGILLEGTEEECFRQVRQTAERIGRERLIIGADCTLPQTMDRNRIRRVAEYCGNLQHTVTFSETGGLE